MRLRRWRRLSSRRPAGAVPRRRRPRRLPPDAKRVDESKAGIVSGRVTFEGVVPESAPIKLDSDPACVREHPNGLKLEPILVTNGGLDNVFVYVKDGLGNYYFDTPTEAVTLDQKGCNYSPHVLGVRTGQPLEIVNSDATLHNVNAMAKVNQGFNMGQAIQGMKNAKVFTAPEVMVRIKCDVHSWMTAYAGVVSHPYFAVTAGRGRVRAQEPAGRHLHDRGVAREARHADRRASRSARRKPRPSASHSRQQPRDLASPLHQVRRRFDGSPDRRRRHGHEHRFGAGGAGLAEHLRPVHVLVPAREDGRRDLLRARPPDDREHGRLPDHHPGDLDVEGRSAPMGRQARRRPRSGRSSCRASSAASRSCCSCRRRCRSATRASRSCSSASRSAWRSSRHRDGRSPSRPSTTRPSAASRSRRR